MKDKLKFLMKQSLDKKMKTKWFKAVNIILLVLLLVLTNIDRIVTFFGGDFESQITILVKDEVNGYEYFKSNFESVATSLGEMKNFKVEERAESIDSLKAELDEENDTILVQFLKDEQNYMKAEIISYDDIGSISKQLITSSVSALKESIAFSESGLSEEQILALTTPVSITSITTNPEIENGENKDLIATGVILVIILPCFFLILMLVQMIGAEVNDEKTTRSMEIIISNVSPKVHFLSKIYASTAFVIIQGLLLVFYAFLALLLRGLLSGGGEVAGEVTSSVSKVLQMVKDTGVLRTLLQGLPFILLLLVFSFVAYAIMAGVLASMTTSIEDFQQLQTPIMMIIMVGYYLAIMASQFEGALFIKLVSYVPMLSFLLSPVLYILGQISVIELGISTLITGAFTFFLFKYGLRIYKVGILNYSSSKLWKKMFKSLKNKES